LRGGRVNSICFGEHADLLVLFALHPRLIDSVGRACIRSNCDLGFPSASRLAGPKVTKGFSLPFRLCLLLLFSEKFYAFKFEEFGHPLLLQVIHANVRHILDLVDYVLASILLFLSLCWANKLSCWSPGAWHICQLLPKMGSRTLGLRYNTTSSKFRNKFLASEISQLQHVKVVKGRTCQCYTRD